LPFGEGIPITKIEYRRKKLSSNVSTITDSEGKKIVLINDIRFRGKTKEE